MSQKQIITSMAQRARMPVTHQPEYPPISRRRIALAIAAQEEALESLDWRLLTWLLRYPLQRADDLVLGVARWASRASVYRHLATLQERRLVEQVLPKTPGSGRRVYLLSNRGLHVLASHLGTAADTLAAEWGADESGVFRLLLRLSTLLVIQNVVNGLIVHAADAMTAQGRRPQLVRWTWQRDLTHRFLYREQPLRLFVDAAVALCLRTPQEDGRMLDQWYGLCLLFTELNDERLMRLRLERLHSFREAPERWTQYQQMMPVLILARSARQREHWQRAADIAALKLRLEPLHGATAVLADPANAAPNLWRFGWRTLATEASCHLQEILSPLPRAALLPELRVEEEQDENDSDAQQETTPASVPAQTSGRLRRIIVGDLGRRAAHITQGAQDERTMVALLGVRLTPRQWSILNILLAHSLLTDEELAIFLHLQRASLRCSLYALHQLGCAEAVNTAMGKRWHLCERGLRVIAAANHLSPRNLAILEEASNADENHLVRRGESWLLQHIQHTAGIYGFFASLAQSAGQQPDHDLCWWETGAMCERRYQVNEQWHNLRPDALAEYRAGERRIRFWLEWDRGTMNVRDLTTKCTAYGHYLASREWARERSPLPLLVCVTPEIAQEQRLARVAQATLAQTRGLMLWTTTSERLDEHGPLAPIWQRYGGTSRNRERGEGSTRQCLFG